MSELDVCAVKCWRSADMMFLSQRSTSRTSRSSASDLTVGALTASLRVASFPFPRLTTDLFFALPQWSWSQREMENV